MLDGTNRFELHQQKHLFKQQNKTDKYAFIISIQAPREFN